MARLAIWLYVLQNAYISLPYIMAARTDRNKEITSLSRYIYKYYVRTNTFIDINFTSWTINLVNPLQNLTWNQKQHQAAANWHRGQLDLTPPISKLVYAFHAKF